MNESKALWRVIELRERYEKEDCRMGWTEFQEGLIGEGYKRLPVFTIETLKARRLNCPDCGRKAIMPRPLVLSILDKSRDVYRLFMLCDRCDYYWEV